MIYLSLESLLLCSAMAGCATTPSPAHTQTHMCFQGGVYAYIEKGTYTKPHTRSVENIKDNSIRCSLSFVASFSSCK